MNPGNCYCWLSVQCTVRLNYLERGELRKLRSAEIMKSTWKTIAIIVAIVIIIAIVVAFLSTRWTTIINEALCAIQDNIGLKTHFHIPQADGSAWTCTHTAHALNP